MVIALNSKSMQKGVSCLSTSVLVILNVTLYLTLLKFSFLEADAYTVLPKTTAKPTVRLSVGCNDLHE